MKRSIGPLVLLGFILLFARPPGLPPPEAPPPGPSPGTSRILPGPPADPEPEERAEAAAGAVPDTPPPAAPAAQESPPPAAKVPASHAALRQLLARQNPDGSWGKGPALLEGHTVGPVAETGLALLALLGSGYSPLSKDTVDGSCPGDAVRAGLQWLMADLGPGGAFRSAREGSLEQAIGALALCEALGMTGSAPFREPALRAMEGLQGFQMQGGSFGDAMTTDWALTAMASARLCELPLWEGGLERLRPVYEAREEPEPDAGTAIFRLWIDRENRMDNWPAIQHAATLIASRPPQEAQSVYALYRDTRALFMIEGIQGRRWREWSPGLRDALLEIARKEPPDGAAVSDTALAALCWAMIGRYEPVFGSR